jgi:hypothetical protein
VYVARVRPDHWRATPYGARCVAVRGTPSPSRSRQSSCYSHCQVELSLECDRRGRAIHWTEGAEMLRANGSRYRRSSRTSCLRATAVRSLHAIDEPRDVRALVGSSLTLRAVRSGDGYHCTGWTRHASRERSAAISGRSR